MSSKVAQIVVGLPVEGPFDYLIPDEFQDKLSVGERVRVSFNRDERVGFVVGLLQKSRFERLKPILSVLDSKAVVSDPLFKLAQEMSRYYGCSLGEAIETMLPNTLRTFKSFEISPSPENKNETAQIPEKILLHDEGTQQRWDLLFKLIDKNLLEQKGVIFLVPETSQIKEVQAKLKDHFDVPIIVLDKKLTPKRELENWQAVKEGKARITIGTRSSVFAPVPNLGAVILFEEDNFSYKQEQTPYYHAREVALMRCAIEKADCVLVSSSPSAESWYLAQKGQLKLVQFKEDLKNSVQLIDLSNYYKKKFSLISFPLRNIIERALLDKKRMVLFLNQRGFSSMTRCEKCGFTAKCPRCNVNLSYLYSKKKLVCRLCQHTADLPTVCPKCQSSYIKNLGTGIEKLESELSRIFPQAKIERFDKESPKAPEADIIIATQAVLRILPKLNPDITAVLKFDSELNRLDFRTSQRVFSTLVHLRQHTKEKLIIQTSHTDNYCLKAVLKADFNLFYKNELKLRKELDFPPFKHLAEISLRGFKEEDVFKQANAFYALLEQKIKKGIGLIEPHASILPKLRDKFHFTIIVKGKSVTDILKVVKAAQKEFSRKNRVVVTVNIDP